MIVICKCGARRTIAGEVPRRPLLSFLFAIFDFAEMTGAGWSYSGGRWACKYCVRRKNLMKAVDEPKFSNVTDPPPPTGEKM